MKIIKEAIEPGQKPKERKIVTVKQLFPIVQKLFPNVKKGDMDFRSDDRHGPRLVFENVFERNFNEALLKKLVEDYGFFLFKSNIHDNFYVITGEPKYNGISGVMISKPPKKKIDEKVIFKAFIRDDDTVNYVINEANEEEIEKKRAFDKFLGYLQATNFDEEEETQLKVFMDDGAKSGIKMFSFNKDEFDKLKRHILPKARSLNFKIFKNDKNVVLLQYSRIPDAISKKYKKLEPYTGE